MPIMKSLRQLDERILPSSGSERERAVRFFPWYAWTTVALYALALATDLDFLHGMIFVMLISIAGASPQLARWMRTGD